MSTAVRRCPWASANRLQMLYHDREWGVPVHDDRVFFEFLVLEGAQAGLSWDTILRKRENYRAAFAGFDPRKVARFGTRDVTSLLRNPGIVRNRLKVRSAISNARAFLGVQQEFGTFDAYIWRFVGGKPKRDIRRAMKDVPSATPESNAMSRDLKHRGFRFVGSTICYAFMQATGLVDDHLVTCFCSGRRRTQRSVATDPIPSPTLRAGPQARRGAAYASSGGNARDKNPPGRNPSRRKRK